ncbi:hypothetical protein DDB_G0292356 [Dictyostelium discoideum AX4]|uniref:Uncharacterized protein n=1 Tax=Dictyostelium discoideum TaxID=44689 RepID=Q54DG2_DICDI|nr:hypothetical protein DDB_G0292356 [Dictyostelium discoideum AX4]EAL61302.1 hypothetical protein DDB_G0292356 [Dictyostelium discoideum AX4]|eukprot:XP_629679.1 hypothetical protein DDB_G0292356 [Dictyostelium discoideum AX4]
MDESENEFSDEERKKFRRHHFFSRDQEPNIKLEYACGITMELGYLERSKILTLKPPLKNANVNQIAKFKRDMNAIGNVGMGALLLNEHKVLKIFICF